MIPCLSPNGETSIAASAPPTSLLIGTSQGVVHLRRGSAVEPWIHDRISLPDKHIGALINAPGGRLFAGCHHKGGLFRSLDKGTSWQQVGEDIAATDIFSLALLGDETGASILAGVEPVNLYRSDDFGESWTELPAISVQPGAELWTFPPPPHLPHLKSIAVDPAAPAKLFGCVEQGALLKTEDGGKSWTELTAMWTSGDKAYRDAHRLVIAPWDSALLFFASGIGVFKSTDGGSSWSKSTGLSERNAYPDVLVASASDRAIFVGGPVDVPGNWPGGNPTGTICRSLDEGSTWTPLAAGGGAAANFEALTICEYPGGYSLYAGDTMGRIFASDDRGDSWQQIASTGAVSKGAHYKLADMSAKFPKPIGKAVTFLFDRLTKITSKRAASQRAAQFARHAATAPNLYTNGH